MKLLLLLLVLPQLVWGRAGAAMCLQLPRTTQALSCSWVGMPWCAGMVLVCWRALRRAVCLSNRGQLQVQLLGKLVGG